MLGGYWMVLGDSVGGDKLRYVERGGRLLAMLPGEESVASPAWDVFDVLYFVPNLLIGLGHRILGADYHLFSIGLHVAMFVAAALGIVALARMLAGGSHQLSLAALGALIVLFLGLPGEIVQYVFNSYSSDVISHFVGTSAMIVIILAMLRCDSRYWAAAAALALVAAVSRPSGVVWVAAWLIGYVSSLVHPSLRTRSIVMMGTVVCLTAFAVWPWIMLELARSDTDVNYGLGLVIDKFQTGTVITGREVPRMENMSDYVDYVMLMALRFVLYFIPFRAGYSLVHVIANGIVVMLVISTAASGLAALKARGGAAAGAGGLLLVAAALFGVVHAATQVEDWRYYLAVWSPIWLLASTGVCRWRLGADWCLRRRSDPRGGR